MPITVSPDDLKDARRRLHGPDREAAAHTCGVSLRQYRRWEAGHSQCPASAYRLLCILGNKDIGELHPDWQGFKLGVDGQVYPPGSRTGYSAQDVNGLFFKEQMADHLKTDLHLAQTELKERPIVHGLQISLTMSSENALQLATMAAAIKAACG